MNAEHWDIVADILSARFEIRLTAAEAFQVCRGWQKMGGSVKRGRMNWSDCTWFMWIKQRLVLPAMGSPGPDVRFATPLHVFFLSLYESEEMIARLPEGGPRDATGRRPRNRLSASTLTALTPIDRVARRVSPQEMKQHNNQRNGVSDD